MVRWRVTCSESCEGGFRRPVRLGSLRRTTPVSDHWGYDRGTPIDRYYIESFLNEHRADVRGACVEVRDTRYTDRFGSSVTRADVLDVDAGNPHATIVVDLADTAAAPSERFDCFILTQTLQARLRRARGALHCPANAAPDRRLVGDGAVCKQDRPHGRCRR